MRRLSNTTPRLSAKAFGKLAAPAAAPAQYWDPTAPENLDVNDILDQYKAPEPTKEEPSLVEAGLRGLKQGVTFGFGDEITGALEHAFTDKSYTQARDEARANDAAAKSAHPWGFGLAEAAGGIGTGIATGGLAGAAAKLGTAGVAGLAAAEGATSGLGNSEADLTKGDIAGAAKDTAVGGAVGGIVGAGLHKLLGGAINTAIERRGKDLNEIIGEGAVPTVRKRLGQATNVKEVGVREGESAASTAAAGSGDIGAVRAANPVDISAPIEGAPPLKAERSLGVNVIDSDPEFLKALDKGKKQALEVVDERLTKLGSKTAPIYDEIDAESAPDGAGRHGIPLGTVVGKLKGAAAEAEQSYSYNVGDAINEHADKFLNIWRKKLDLEPGVDLNAVNIPTVEVRKLATKLQQEATRSMGSLSETERLVVKRDVAALGKKILDDHLDEAARVLPDTLAPRIQELRDINDKLFVYASAKDALEASSSTAHTKGPGLMKSLFGASVPGLAGLALSGGNPVGFAAGAAGAVVAQKALKRVSREATFALSKLVRASKAGNATADLAIDTIKAGVPVATVNAIMSSVGQQLGTAGLAYGVDGLGSAFEGKQHGGHGGGEE